MILFNFYLLLLGFAMINFSFCYDYLLDYESDSVPVLDIFQRRSVNSKNHNHRRTDQIKSRNNVHSGDHLRQQKKDEDDVVYLDLAKFLNPSEKYDESYDSKRSITENDLDSRFQEPSKEVRKARKFERGMTRRNHHDDKEYYFPANRNRSFQKKIKPSRSNYLGSFNENSGAARLKPALKRDASLKTSFRNSKNKFVRLPPHDKARSNKERRFSIFHKNKKLNKTDNKNNVADKKANKLDVKDKKLNEKPIPQNKELKTSAKNMKLNPAKESKPLKQIHVCPLCKREMENVQRESGKRDSNGDRFHRVKSLQSRKPTKNSRHGVSGRRATRKRIYKNDSYK